MRFIEWWRKIWIVFKSSIDILSERHFDVRGKFWDFAKRVETAIARNRKRNSKLRFDPIDAKPFSDVQRSESRLQCRLRPRGPVKTPFHENQHSRNVVLGCNGNPTSYGKVHSYLGHQKSRSLGPGRWFFRSLGFY